MRRLCIFKKYCKMVRKLTYAELAYKYNAFDELTRSNNTRIISMSISSCTGTCTGKLNPSLSVA
jgi:hypothetical protein